MRKILTTLLSIAIITVCLVGCDAVVPLIGQSKVVKSYTVATVFQPMILVNKSTVTHNVKPKPNDGFFTIS